MTATEAFPIVAVGASAGGLEPLEGLLKVMPAEPAMAFVIATHLNPERPSMLPEILARATWMQVGAAADGMEVQPGHVYVLAPNTIVGLENGRLRVRPPDPGHRERNPIDILFGSLATDQGHRAVGIVLSGGGSDGTLGLKAIKEAGGVTMAQGIDHTAPRHPSMPSSAIATGTVDIVAPVENMAEHLVRIAVGSPLVAVPDDNKDDKAARALNATRKTICAILKKQTHHDFSGYKPSTFLRRVGRRMQVLHLRDIDDFVGVLRRDPDEVQALFRDLLINVTNFFRDTEAFDALETHIPRLLDGKGPDDAVRVWVPGCATGEEVYSIAMLMLEHTKARQDAPKVQIFATDIDESALSVARRGHYPIALVERVSPGRLERFFVRGEGAYTVSKDVRDMVIFSSHSLVRDPPFSRIDLVSCRNLLIYLGAELQDRVVPIFHYALRPGGLLFLGLAENVTQHPDLFAPCDKKNRIFRRLDRDLPTPPFPVYIAGSGLPQLDGRSAGPREGTRGLLRLVAEARVLERYAPAFVVVDADGDILHFSGRTGKYVEQPAGSPTRQLLSMARKGLRLDLGAVMAEVRHSQRPVTRSGLMVDVDDRVQVFDLTVEPFAAEGEGSLYLVIFTDIGVPVTADEAAAGRCLDGTPDGDTVHHLEQELHETRERLQSLIEEYETAIEELKSSNEELVSMNEELQSTTEELETAKEEQQSVNEELETVNLELHRKVSDLDRANDDMRNLFASIRIATVFLDRNLVIRSFTPDAASLFNVIPSDVGRPLSDIVHRLDYPTLKSDIIAVHTSGEPMERKVALVTEKGQPNRHYLARLRPYSAESGSTEGVVATFIDVTRLVEAEEHQRVLVAELNHRVKNMLSIVLALAAQTGASATSTAEFLQIFKGRIRAMARTFELLSREHWNDISLRELLRGALQPAVEDLESRISLDGPEVILCPKAGLSLGMVVHELATNAIKHGALSAPAGSVSITWSIGKDRLDFGWRETDGPAVHAAPEQGFGTRLIQGEVTSTLKGDCRVDFAENGVQVHLSIPVAGHVIRELGTD